jgi:Protein of unknown function (DUF1593)
MNRRDVLTSIAATTALAAARPSIATPLSGGIKWFSTTQTERWRPMNGLTLGAAYPKFAFIMEGDTPSFLGLIPNGVNAPENPNWGGWGGRYIWRQPYGETHPIWTQGGDLFRRVTSADTVNGHTSDQATIWRWRQAYQNDFAARMDWTVKPYKAANHPPEVTVTTSVAITPQGTQTMTLVASARDPDGNKLTYHWFPYPEAGAHEGVNLADVTVQGNGPRATVTAISPCRKAWIDGLVPCKGSGFAHIILAVTDNGTPALTRYRRVVFEVKSKEGLADQNPELFPK